GHAMEDEDIRQMIRAKLGSRKLPPEHPSKTWAGPRTRQTCAACERHTGSGTVEMEAAGADGEQRFYHFHCYTLLQSERARLSNDAEAVRLFARQFEDRIGS